VGAGAGNTAFPILAHNQNPSLKIHACDFSKKAVEVIRENEAYDTESIQADVWDVASEVLPPGLAEGSVDLVLMIFIFSALSPVQWKQAVQNIHRVLKPNGEVLFRDYGRGDLAQVRFKKGRYLEENFYIRGDGTRVYFFDKDELVRIWSEQGSNASETNEKADSLFEVVDLGVDRRLLVNRAKQLKMYRCWMQGRFRKQLPR
jgi:tRNAThr (cytosine32-N3)-methyltransferase